MLRIILGIKLKEQIPTKEMLDNVGMLSVNQIACHSILMETWKALHLEVESISAHFQLRNSKRFADELQGSNDPKSFISCAARLYNKTSKRFKQTNLTKVARIEALDTVKLLPI